MNLNRHVYIPDQYFDCGCAGEHPGAIVYSVSVDYEGGAMKKNVTIWNVTVTIQIEGQDPQFLDITKKILDSYAEREAWEDEIFQYFSACRRRNYEEGA